MGHRVRGLGTRKHVNNHPDAAQMDKGKKAGGTDGKDRHGLGGPCNGIAPSGPEQVQNRRYQRSRVGDTDPEHEIDQIDSPVNRVVLAAHPDADKNLVHPATGAEKHPHQQQRDQNPVGFRSWPQGIQYGVVNTLEGQFSHGIS